MPVANASQSPFDSFSRLYDRVRPGYPEELVDDIIDAASMPKGGTILEIGSGTGKATALFARRGFCILCIELGEKLTQFAKAKFQNLTNVDVQQSAFERFVPSSQFDLVISAQAFHYIDPDVGYRRIDDSLKPQGTMALFWNDYQSPNTPLSCALDDLYRQHAPELTPLADRIPCGVLEKERTAQIIRTGFFENLITKRYSWSTSYTADQYVSFLLTSLQHRHLPQIRKSALLRGIHAKIELCGGVFPLTYTSMLHLAQKKARGS